MRVQSSRFKVQSGQAKRTWWVTAALGAVVIVAATMLLIWGQQRTSQSLNARTQVVASQLRCPICQGESVNDSPSALAQDMRGIIRRRLQAGQSPYQVKAYFVSRYGQWILLAPPSNGIGALVWLGPLFLLGLGLVVLVVAARRWRKARASTTGGGSEALWRRNLAPGSMQGSEPETRDAGHRARPYGCPGPSLATRDPLTVREEIVLALERLDDDMADGTLSRADYVVERDELEGRLRELDGAISRTAPSDSPTARRRGVPRTALALVAIAIVVGASISIAVQPRRAGAITGSVPQVTPTQAPIPADVARAASRLDAHPRLLSAWIDLGNALTRHGNYGGAREAYLGALGISAHDQGAELGLAFVDVLTNKPREALARARDVVRRQPESTRAWLLQGLAWREIPNHKHDAITAWRRFLALDPHNSLASQVRRWITQLHG